MPPKKAISKSETVTEVITDPISKSKTKSKKVLNNEDVDESDIIDLSKNKKLDDTEKTKTKSKKTDTTEKTKTKKADDTVKTKSKSKKVDDIEKSKKVDDVIEDTIDETKKSKTKKISDTEIDSKISVSQKTDNVEYNILKAEWVILCDKIKEANKEKELLEIQKNQLLNKLWKLGETSYPKVDNIFDNINKKQVINKVSSIQTKILDNDSSDSYDSDSSVDSNSEPKKPTKSKTNMKKPIESDSDTSDSDSN